MLVDGGCCNIISLDLSGCGIGNPGIRSLKNANWPGLKTLSLSIKIEMKMQIDSIQAR